MVRVILFLQASSWTSEKHETFIWSPTNPRTVFIPSEDTIRDILSHDYPNSDQVACVTCDVHEMEFHFRIHEITPGSVP